MPAIYEVVEHVSKHDRLVGFACDKCKRSFDMDDDVLECQEMMRWANSCGYGSVWGDGAYVEVTLCQSCAHELFKGFAVVSDS